jgi:hypothetical protein
MSLRAISRSGVVSLANSQRSMRKSEVQPLVSLVFGCLKICLLLFLVHALPNPLALLVNIHVIQFRANEDHKVPCTDRNQHLVTSPVVRLVVVAVDVLADDTTSLHAHIVKC